MANQTKDNSGFLQGDSTSNASDFSRNSSNFLNEAERNASNGILDTLASLGSGKADEPELDDADLGDFDDSGQANDRDYFNPFDYGNRGGSEDAKDSGDTNDAHEFSNEQAKEGSSENSNTSDNSPERSQSPSKKTNNPDTDPLNPSAKAANEQFNKEGSKPKSATQKLADKEAAPGGFKNNVTKKSPLPRKGGKTIGLGKGKFGSAKSYLQKGSPIMAVIAILASAMFSTTFFQQQMPMALDANIHDNMNSMRTSAMRRSPHLMKNYMARNKVSKRQETKLKAHGFEVLRDVELQKGKKGAAIKYIDDDGVEHIVVHDKKNAVGGKEYLWDLYNKDARFRDKWFNATKTWRGAAYQWFDSKTSKLFKALKLKRDKWRGFENSTKADPEPVKSEIKDIAEVDGSSLGKETKEQQEGGDSEKPGGEEPKPDSEIVDDVDTIKADAKADLDTNLHKLENFVESRTKKLNKGSDALNITCAVTDAVGAAGLIIAAGETAQILQVGIPIFEAIEKAKAGDGASSPINVISNMLVINATKRYYNDFKIKSDGSHESSLIEKTGSAMSSAGVGALFGRHGIDPKDPSIRSFNVFGRLTSLPLSGGFSPTAFKNCSYSGIANATLQAASGIVTIVQIATCVFGAASTMGASCGPLVGTAIKNIAVTATISTAVQMAMSALLPAFAEFFMRDLTANLAGEDLGNVIVLAGNIIMGRNHRAGGGRPASKEALLAYNLVNQSVIAENARIERDTRSPFDASSPYTFMGTVMNKLIPLTYDHDRFGGSLATVSDIAFSSLRSLSPTASAAEATGLMVETAKNTATACPLQDSIGAVAFADCNEINITDVTTLASDEDDYKKRLVDDKQITLDDEGNATVVKDSKLAKDILFCGERQSTFGVADQNIASSFSVDTGFSPIDNLIGAIPAVGDLGDILSEGNKLMNIGYITGEACVIGNSGPGSAPSWEEAKDYQRFIEDQRLEESMGLIERSAVSVFLDDYYQEHPIDDSFEGILASYSGLTKEKVIATLDTMKYLAHVAQYDAVGRLPEQALKQEPQLEIQLEEQHLDLAAPAIALSRYVDHRRYDNIAMI